MRFKLYTPQFLVFAIMFILFTVIGTLSHEFGHIAVARYLGYKTELHFASMNYKDSDDQKRIFKIYENNKQAIETGQDFNKKQEYLNGIDKLNKDILYVSLGGPLQTIFTGLMGFVFLVYKRNTLLKNGLKFIDWLFVFFSLFWLRQIFNSTIGIANGLIKRNGIYFGGDEKKISELLNLPIGAISISFGLLGLAICVYVIFVIIPKRIRFTFLCGGFVGGICGFILWMLFLGPKLLP